MTKAEMQQVHMVAEKVLRKRQENAARIAGCPLELFAEGRSDYVARGTTPRRHISCGCHCHDSARRAA